MSLSENDGSFGESHHGWFFFHPDAVPPRWKERGRPAVFVPLLPDEVAELVEGGFAGGPDADERLMVLIAQGVSTDDIARSLGLSSRSVQRRIARLRRHHGATSKEDLGRRLARLGFAEVASNRPNVSQERKQGS